MSSSQEKIFWKTKPEISLVVTVTVGNVIIRLVCLVVSSDINPLNLKM